MNKFLPLAAFAALCAGPALAQTMTPADYVKAAGAGDLFEKESSKEVLETTKDPKIKSFAQEMITDHTKSTNMVKAAAKTSHVKAEAPMLTPPQADMLAKLKAEKDGPARDKLYVSQQKDAHDQALAVQKGYAESGTDPALKAAAGKIQPVVESHIAMLKTM